MRRFAPLFALFLLAACEEAPRWERITADPVVNTHLYGLVDLRQVIALKAYRLKTETTECVVGWFELAPSGRITSEIRIRAFARRPDSTQAHVRAIIQNGTHVRIETSSLFIRRDFHALCGEYLDTLPPDAVRDALKKSYIAPSRPTAP